MATDLIRYDLLAQDALRGLVRRVLGDVARDGLPGEHHFYISFRTDAPGVKLSPRIREQHPSEMTIVLQHQFWDLDVTDTHFAVGLSFGGVPERLFVPYEALSGFFDPSVQFGLKFEKADEAAATEADEVPDIRPDAQDVAELSTSPRPVHSMADATPPAADKDPDAAQGDSAQVVSLDKFRKK